MKQTITLGLFLTGVLAIGLAATANPSYMQLFRRVEKPPPKSRLDRAQCLTCHVKPGGGKALNPYGLDFRKNGANENSLKSIRPLDSDSDGGDNASEIVAGTLPGDSESKPRGGNVALATEPTRGLDTACPDDGRNVIGPDVSRHIYAR